MKNYTEGVPVPLPHELAALEVLAGLGEQHGQL
jgi:hypothetical protein